jgi:hypothetical protein
MYTAGWTKRYPAKASRFKSFDLLLETSAIGQGDKAKFQRNHELVLSATVTRDALPEPVKQRVPESAESFNFRISFRLEFTAQGEIENLWTQKDSYSMSVGATDNLEVGSMFLRPIISHDGQVSADKFPYLRYREERDLSPDPDRAWHYQNSVIKSRLLEPLQDGALPLAFALDFAELKDGKKRWTQRAQLGSIELNAKTIKQHLDENVQAIQTKDKRLRVSDPPAAIGCFITTCVCEHVGLADDCWELSTMRRFRDRWSVRDQGNRAMVQAYYREAPALAEALSHRPDGQRVSAGLYLKYILPMAVLARLRMDRLVVPYYKRLLDRVRRLANQ